MVGYIQKKGNEKYAKWYRNGDFIQKLTEMSRDIKYIREDVAEMKEGMKAQNERVDRQDIRISNIEQTQKLITGKLSIIIIGIGAFVVGAIQAAIWILDKIAK